MNVKRCPHSDAVPRGGASRYAVRMKPDRGLGTPIPKPAPLELPAAGAEPFPEPPPQPTVPFPGAAGALWRDRGPRWELTDPAACTESGWVWQGRGIAPLARVQAGDTERGPLEQLFGLANVTVTTASAAGPLRIHGLDVATAHGLVADLTEVTSHSVGDAT